MNVAIIPARGGSTRIPGKNKREFFGVPMIGYAIKACKDTGLFDSIIVSTDDPDIYAIAERSGCMLHQRDGEHAQDHVGTQEVARYVLTDEVIGEHILADAYLNGRHGRAKACVVYPCVPLLDWRDLRIAEQQLTGGFNYIMSVGTEPLHDAGCFYWGSVDAFIDRLPLISLATRIYPLPANRVCDINTEADWRRAEQMYQALVDAKQMEAA